MQALEPIVARIGFNDDMPKLAKNGVRVVFQALKGEWHHTAELIVFVDKNDSATIAEYKRTALAQATLVLEAMLAGLHVD